MFLSNQEGAASNLAVAHFQVMEGVCLEHPVQGLLPLLKAKLGVLWEGAIDVAAYDLVYLLLAYTDLQQGVVARVL